jgi:hypothetical protein
MSHSLSSTLTPAKVFLSLRIALCLLLLAVGSAFSQSGYYAAAYQAGASYQQQQQAAAYAQQQAYAAYYAQQQQAAALEFGLISNAQLSEGGRFSLVRQRRTLWRAGLGRVSATSCLGGFDS